MIKKNMNTLDRAARMLIGIACVWAGFWDSDVISNEILSLVVGVFGLINIVSAIFAHCPVYLVAGLSTLQKNPDDANG